MILFFGYSDDVSLVRATEAASVRGVKYLFADQREPSRLECTLEMGVGEISGTLALASDRYALSDIAAVYARPLSPVDDGTAVEARHSRRLLEVLSEWLDVADAIVVNRPSRMHSNTSKPYQMQLAAEVGFEVPETLITSDPEEALEFRHRHGDIIFKSISGIRSIVTRLDEARARDLYKLRSLPTQFQAYVPGVDVRVHVIGSSVIATEIRTRATDYRYARAEGASVALRPIDLPDDIAQRCLAAAKTLGLSFCGIDLRVRPDGVPVCLEINPMPGYSYFESETGQAISTALIDFLIDKGGTRNGASHRKQDRLVGRDSVAAAASDFT